MHFLENENVWIPIKISLKFVPTGPINNIPALVQIMAWHRPSDKPLSEPMMVRLPTHVCVTRPQWVKLVCYLFQCIDFKFCSLHDRVFCNHSGINHNLIIHHHIWVNIQKFQISAVKTLQDGQNCGEIIMLYRTLVIFSITNDSKYVLVRNYYIFSARIVGQIYPHLILICREGHGCSKAGTGSY